MQCANGPMALMGTGLVEMGQASRMLSAVGAKVLSMPPGLSPRDTVRLVTASVGRPPSSLVTVVDLERLHSARRAWLEQVESSDVLLLTGAPMGDQLAVLRQLQPRATLVRLDDLSPLTAFRRFDPEDTPRSSGVYRALQSEVLPCDKHVFVYRTTGAFDLAEWRRVVVEWPAEVLRAFGCITIGDTSLVLDQMGSGEPELFSEGDPPAGAELALIGPHLNRDQLKALLDSALLVRPSSLRLLATRRRQRYGSR